MALITGDVMTFEGNPEVIENLRRKRKLLRVGSDKAKAIRPAIVYTPGAQGGARGVAVAKVLLEWGLIATGNHPVVDHLIGTSTGGALVLITCSRKVEDGANVYFKVCTKRAFVSFLRFWQVQNVEYLERNLRLVLGQLGEGPCAVREFPGSVHVGVSDQDGRGHLCDAKTARPDAVALVVAGCTIPALSKPYLLEGEPRYDGGVHGFFFREAVKEFDPTDLLVVMSQPKNGGTSDFYERYIYPLLWQPYPLLWEGLTPSMRRALATRHERWMQELKFLEELRHPRVAVISARTEMEPFCNDENRLVQEYNGAQKDIRFFLEECAKCA